MDGIIRLLVVLLAFSENASATVSAFASANFRWKSGSQIPVCFENPQDGTAEQLAIVQYAITKSWQLITNLDFIFSTNSCGNTTSGIRIKISDDGDLSDDPHCSGITVEKGRPVTCHSSNTADGIRMLLNFKPIRRCCL